MPTANIHRRDSIERVYPSDAFASDGARNGRVTNQVICGVRILSAPDAAGEFSFERGSHHVGELHPQPFWPHIVARKSLTNAGRDGPTDGPMLLEPHAGYQEFLANIVAVAQQFGFEPEKSAGRAEPRLQGLRQ
jgi:hypothetical protein